jgi:hypothetical protein
VLDDDGAANVSLPRRPADVLVALALAGESGRTKRWLRRQLWSDLDGDDPSVVTTAIADLRSLYHVQIPRPGDNQPYVLGYPPAQIDSRRFIDGVEALPPGYAGSAALDALLRLWRGNPWERDSQVPEACWSEVRAKLRQLLRRVSALSTDQRAELSALPALQQRLAGNELFDELDQQAKPQVLIVDDQIGAEMADVLGGDYECEVIDSLGCWNRRVESGQPFRHVCALVDLHLKRAMVDREGLKVVEDLKRLSTMPIVLFSAELPPFVDHKNLERTYGVQMVMAKHNQKLGDLLPVRNLVQELVRTWRPPAAR